MSYGVWGSEGKPRDPHGNQAPKRGEALAILDEANLAAEAAKRATYRVNHVGTKLNEGELREIGDMIPIPPRSANLRVCLDSLVCAALRFFRSSSHSYRPMYIQNAYARRKYRTYLQNVYTFRITRKMRSLQVAARKRTSKNFPHFCR